MLNLFGDFSKKEIKRNKKTMNEVLSLEETMSKLSDKELQNKTNEFKDRLSKGETLDDLLVEAFAVVREASSRTLGMTPYPVQILGGITLHNGQIAEIATGDGKALTNSSKIPTPEGWRTVGDIKVGDYLFGRDGKPTKVLATYPQKEKKQVYEVELVDGRIQECCSEHLWEVYTDSRNKNTKTFNTDFLFKNQHTGKRGYAFRLPVNKPVEFEEKNLPLDPYIYGVLLGDGCIGDVVCVSTVDDEIIKTIAKKLNADPINYNNNVSYYFKHKGTNGRIKYKEIRGNLEIGKLYSHEKYIDDIYKFSSISQRLELLKGLMDTDGCIDTHIDKYGYGRYNLTFSTVSERLRDDILEVIRSLGYNASKHLGKSQSKGNKVKRDQFVININLDHKDKCNFFSLPRYLEACRKAEAQGPRRKDYTKVAIKEVRKTDRYEDMTCFTVDSEDHLFLTGDFIVTHNTLVATMPAYLNALEGKGVHVVTVNDYLAKRDMEQMSKIYNFLGLTTGLITQDMDVSERQDNYNKDITYGTNNQIGFDYLKDNMVVHKEDRSQRPLHYAIVDEIDSILIDEARTPLIIAGKSEDTVDDYQRADEFAKSLSIRIMDPKEKDDKDPFDRKFKEEKVDVLVDEKDKTATLTGQGTRKAEKYFDVKNLADLENMNLYHNINNAVKANYSMKRDIDYVVKNGKVEIVDEFTGRILIGRRFSEGLHQALEAKENVDIQPESKTFATITFQNLFRMYDKLSGMTGTAKTEEEEFSEIYKLDVVSIPTNKPIKRVDSNDFIFIDEESKYKAITNTVEKIHQTGQPILIGTSSIKNSEIVSEHLKKRGIKHVVLNAKNDEKEAEIVAQAGKLNSVTIATNMAGRGTDIMLGGNLDFMAKEDMKAKGISEELIEEADTFYEIDNQEILEVRKLFKQLKNKHREQVKKEAEKVKELGGLYILGTERHDSRRVDNQLRGRSGRQGDPGYSKFFISLEDDLIRLNSTDMIRGFIEKSNLDENTPITSPLITRAVEKAQKRVEANNFQTRKNTLKFDDVMNQQRTIVYKERNKVLDGGNVHDSIMEMIEDTVEDVVKRYTTNDTKTELWHLNSMFEHLDSLNVILDDLHFENIENLDKEDEKTQERIIQYIFNRIKDRYNTLNLEDKERIILLGVVDKEWVNHLDVIEQMKKEVNVRAMGNDDPVQVFTKEAFNIYQDMIKDIRQETTRLILDVVAKEVEEIN